MFVVIFRAEAGKMDEGYAQTAAALREMALRDFGCLEFHSVSEGAQEITLSYWPDETSIMAWKAQAEHLAAQKRGGSRWYASYRVQVARIERDYSFPRSVP
ncbi:MAG TPA: antibiotic biosynthesis monooxygenase [Acidocella sp.]|jgi:heme-degrading monooxygenase HmoA|nr:antibiotic biosynthesis monooxygenase [Acidocella sp.]